MKHFKGAQMSVSVTMAALFSLGITDKGNVGGNTTGVLHLVPSFCPLWFCQHIMVPQTLQSLSKMYKRTVNFQILCCVDMTGAPPISTEGSTDTTVAELSNQGELFLRAKLFEELHTPRNNKVRLSHSRDILFHV